MRIKGVLFLLGLIILSSVPQIFADEIETPRPPRESEKFTIKITPWGPTQADVTKAKTRAEQSAAVQGLLRGSKYRLLAFEYIYSSDEKKDASSQPPTRYRVTFYNYSTDTAVIAESDFAAREPVTVSTGNFDPGTGAEEINAAFAIVRADADYSKNAGDGKLEIYEAMPPVSNLNGERLVNVGVRNQTTGENTVVGVSFKNSRVIRYQNNAPPTSRATVDSCGIQSAGQGATAPGVAGQYQLTTFSHGIIPLWKMLVVRPSASSGASNERSGLEIRDVFYKGKSVLKRGHVPVLNVQYVDDTCGPFRDWQYGEGFFQIPETGVSYPNGVSGGIAVLPEGTTATTAVETRNDTGNFQGVAIYQQDVGNGNELVLVTELTAGWYRYIMEWRFGPDGVIRPRYGFGSTTNSCVCESRYHHVYWRFDFDIVTPTNRVFQVERGRKFMRPITTESSIFRSYSRSRGLVVQNSTSDEAYSIFPNLNDGQVTNADGILTDTFGAGDFWVMLFKGTSAAPSEIDDPNLGAAAANLAPWVNGDGIVNQDVVIWYAAHQFRNDDASRPEVIKGSHIVGPDLRPIRW